MTDTSIADAVVDLVRGIQLLTKIATADVETTVVVNAAPHRSTRTEDHDPELMKPMIETLGEVTGMNLMIATVEDEEGGPLQNEEGERSVVERIIQDDAGVRLLFLPIRQGLNPLIQSQEELV
mmetsp:Transcript_17210/g.28590  ORF Transcript_17210/g.28590 Transcript_17210/m.28590 type:complete len:123 (+) Transcript_17210:230-598(+)